MPTSVEEFKNHILAAEIIDPEGIHHEFSSGSHGQKIDFDKIPTDSDLYDEWVQLTAEHIANEYAADGQMPQAVMGVAYGTNRLALDVPKRLNHSLDGYETEKVINGLIKIRLTQAAIAAISGLPFVVVLEDAGTTGQSAAQVAVQLESCGVGRVEVVNTWQRSARLSELDRLAIRHTALIKEELPTHKPAECRRIGFCADGWELIERQK